MSQEFRSRAKKVNIKYLPTISRNCINRKDCLIWGALRNS